MEIAIVDADNKIMIVSLLCVRWPINEHGGRIEKKKKTVTRKRLATQGIDPVTYRSLCFNVFNSLREF